MIPAIKMKTAACVLAAFFLLPHDPAHAQPPQTIGAAVVYGGPTLSASNSSSRVALPTTNPPGNALTIWNSGAKDAFYVLGTSTVTATTSGIPVRAGSVITVWAGTANTHLAAITGGADTTTLQLYQSNGPLFIQTPGAGGSGGPPSNVTIVGPLGPAAKAASVSVASATDPDTRTSSGNITIQDTGSTSTSSGQNGATLVTGSPTANSTQAQAINGISTARIQVTGAWTGTLQFEGSVDGGTTWSPVPARVTSTGFTQSAVTGNGLFDTDASGLTNIRTRATAAMTGTAAVQFVFSSVGGPVQVQNPVRVMDNSSGATVTVKPASTAPASTDTGHVVSLHPLGNSVGGYEIQLAPTVTVQNAAYSAGNSEGGLITATGAARVNGGSGILIGLRLKSTGGSTNTVWIYGWSKTPTGTCTDKAAYVANAADNPYALVGFPVQATLGGSPGAWDTATYAQIAGLISPFNNQDSSPGTAIYFCIVTAGSVTPATTSDLSFNVAGIKD